MRYPRTILSLLVAPALFAQEEAPPIPHVTVMPNFQVFSHTDKEFDAYEFWNGKSMVRVEGRFWDRHFTIKEGATHPGLLQVHRNYINAVKGMGGVVIFDGLNPEGGHQLLLKASKSGRDIWIQINYESEGFEYRIRMLETEAMRQDITASGLMKALESEGHIALDVRFATNKADILPESKPILDQMVALMKENPALKVSIEGHTDSSGNAATNKGLSEKRAQSVVAALKAAGVAADRLSAAGWGSEKSVADNATEAGRAKNRRVELVKK